MPPVRPVEIPYDLLQDPQADLSSSIEKAYGPDGLGILTVSGVPGFEEKRQRLLPLAAAFAALPDATKALYEQPSSSYNVGWSHGKERLVGGEPDRHKGSFYANPLQDSYPGVDGALASAFPSYYTPNLWPREHLPALEGAFKELGCLITHTGLLLARHCAKYLTSRLGSSPQTCLANLLVASNCHKARLLHYFPPTGAHGAGAAAGAAAPSAGSGGDTGGGADDGGRTQAAVPDAADTWCGWHRDHCALTGLCAAMYLRRGCEVASPDPRAGLYIQTRGGAVVQACIPPSHLGFQLGQALAIQSGGLLAATPHCVRGPDPPRAAANGAPNGAADCVARGGCGTSRNTFAVFMQPEVTALLGPPAAAADPTGAAAGAGASPSRRTALLRGEDSGKWRAGMSFGEFAELTMRGYYGDVRGTDQSRRRGVAVAPGDA